MTTWRVAPDTSVSLSAIETRSTKGAPGDQAATTAALAELNDDLAALQERLWAERSRSLLVVLQAMDTAGKDSTIKNVFSGVNPQGVHVTSFKAPTSTELEHDFLWRIHSAAPGDGDIGVFNRSHYEDVLVVRVKDLVPEAVWSQRFQLINNFERQLTHGGTTVIKFFLHISESEQAKRLQARLDNPDKRWKFNPDDLTERARWPAYQHAYQEAIERTSTSYAPWHIIPADRKWYRNWAVARVVVDTLKAMNPQFPDPPEIDPNLRIV